MKQIEFRPKVRDLLPGYIDDENTGCFAMNGDLCIRLLTLLILLFLLTLIDTTAFSLWVSSFFESLFSALIK